MSEPIFSRREQQLTPAFLLPSMGRTILLERFYQH
jgi:hypothetical protein